jgi:hypothetical protein
MLKVPALKAGKLGVGVLVGVAGGSGVEVFVGTRVGVGELVGVFSGVDVKVIV